MIDLPEITVNKLYSMASLPRDLELAWIQILQEKKLNPTLHPEWLHVVLSSWRIDPEGVRVLTVYKGSRLLGLLPYILETKSTLGIPLRVLSFASNLVSYHAEIICEMDTANFLEKALSGLPRWDKLYIENVIDSGPSATAVRKLCRKNRWFFIERQVDISPYLPLEGMFSNLLNAKNRKFRYKYRKRNKIMRESEEMVLTWYNEPGHASAFLEALIEVEANSWKAQSRVHVSRKNREGRYYAQLIPFLANHNALMANVLWHEKTPIAYSLCCHWGFWIGHLKTGFDRRFNELSPGALSIDGCLEAAFETDAKEFDFLGTPGKGQAEAHKLHWTKIVRRHVSFEIFADRMVPRILGFLKMTRDNFIKQKFH